MPSLGNSYYATEFEIARDPNHPSHCMPTIRPSHKVILDVGCGMGQTLVAAGLAPDAEGYGVDPDPAAIEAGKEFVPPNIHLAVGSGEKLDFPDNRFDLVICRIALHHMMINRALQEMARVLKPGGEMWLQLHPVSMYKKRGKKSLQRAMHGSVNALTYFPYVGLNSMMFHFFGVQLEVLGRRETFQTERGMRRALKRVGLEPQVLRNDRFFVMEAKKTVR